MTGPVPLRLSATQAERFVHGLAQNSANVILTDHAKDRMDERGILRADLDRILRSGMVMEAPFRNRHGDWQCKIVKRLVGGRDAAAVTAIARQKKLIVITVEWEDIP